MIRRSSFIALSGSALMVAACGRQVTPSAAGTSPGSGLPAGYMQVKFRVYQPFDFTKYAYAIVFNTSGDGSIPRADGTNNAWAGYSFAIIMSGAGSPSATAWQFFRNGTNTVAPVLLSLPYPGQLLQQQLNSNGQGTEFTVLFSRLLAAGLSTGSPSPSPASSATPTATPSPSPSPTGSASPSPSPSPTPTLPSGVASSWNYNLFVTAAGNIQAGSALTIADSLGGQPSGANDTTYNDQPFGSLNVLTSFDTGTLYPQAGIHPSDASGIQSFEISNNP